MPHLPTCPPLVALHCGPELPCEAAVLHEQGGGGRQHGEDYGVGLGSLEEGCVGEQGL